MKSKKLQSNFTTPEQSKRLLEIGVPTWTADCYYNEYGKMEIKNTALDILYTPCWSVGRLIEILKICIANKTELDEIFEELEMCIDVTQSLVNNMIFIECRGVIDFSKLELN